MGVAGEDSLNFTIIAKPLHVHAYLMCGVLYFKL